MSGHLTVCAVFILLTACGPSRAKDAVIDAKRFAEIEPAAAKKWIALQRDLTGHRFWTAPSYLGAVVAIEGQPLWDGNRNPILVRICDTPVWCHVDVQPREWDYIQDWRHHADSISLIVLGRVTSINWYTQHVRVHSLLTEVGAAE